MADCIFCEIIKHKVPADIVYQDKQVIVFKDIRPSSPIHLLIVAKKHIKSINELTAQDKGLASHMIFIGQKMAKEHKTAKAGYKLIFNVGRGGGQIIDHLHLHLMGGGD